MGPVGASRDSGGAYQPILLLSAPGVRAPWAQRAGSCAPNHSSRVDQGRPWKGALSQGSCALDALGRLCADASLGETQRAYRGAKHHRTETHRSQSSTGSVTADSTMLDKQQPLRAGLLRGRVGTAHLPNCTVLCSSATAVLNFNFRNF